MSEDDDTRRKRLRHRSRYRGFKEADLIFQRFADDHLDTLSGDALDQFEALVDEADQDVVSWVMGRRHVPARHDNSVFRRLCKSAAG